MMRIEERQSGLEATARRREKVPVKLELEDCSEEEEGPPTKRSRVLSNFQQQWNIETGLSDPALPYDSLDEPSPLGLRLRKSPSLLDLIQMKLSQGSASVFEASPNEDCSLRDKNDVKVALLSGEKLKASNFPASLLRIGCWEYKSKYEGDLVAKCYFAKHKLVWEVLEGGLKSKIEVQWSDIMGLKANFPGNGLATLNVVLARQPLFFRETNPQPRKHTIWQATSDFTDGQASIQREHFLQCPHGVLNKHFEKLIQCDMRLNFLSRLPAIVLDSPYFEPRVSVYEGPNDTKNLGLNNLEAIRGSSSSDSPDTASLSVAQSSFKFGRPDPIIRTTESLSGEAPSPSSVMDEHSMEGNGISESDEKGGTRNKDRSKELHPSISVEGLVAHIGNCISGKMGLGNPHLSSMEAPDCQDLLQDISQCLLSDSQLTTAAAADEKFLMSRVNSLYSLLQKDPTMVQDMEAPDKEKDVQLKSLAGTDGISVHTPAGNSLPLPTMSRKDSYGDLLLHLPRIASLPKCLFDISEDGENQAR